jgi:hypothetical protein
MKTCSCKSDDFNFSVIDLNTLTTLANEPAIKSAQFTLQRVVQLDDRLAVASGTSEGDSGCLTLPILGIPVKLCWEFKEFNLNLPKVSVKIQFEISVRDSRILSKTVHFECQSIVDPSTCAVSISTDNADRSDNQMDALALGGCQWKCLAGCAPGCVSCGTNKWCWALCAARCLFKCCL